MGLGGALLLITQEEEETPHLIKAVRGLRHAKVHYAPLTNFTVGSLFELFSFRVALNCILPVFDSCRIASLKSTDRQNTH